MLRQAQQPNKKSAPPSLIPILREWRANPSFANTCYGGQGRV